MGAAVAQTYPTQPVTIVVPYPPGGAVDGVARVLANELSETTGGNFVVENRAGGAGGMVGSATVANADPDGYTLLLNASIHVVVPLINANTPFDVVEDFTHIGGVAAGPLLITTTPTVEADTLDEFLELVRADPDGFMFATSSYGSAGHLALEMLKMRTGLETEIIAYRGAAPALTDVMSGEVQLIADPMMSSLPHVQSGTLKPLAVTSPERSSLAPDIATVEESSVGEFDVVSWYALWGPADLDEEVRGFLERTVDEVVNSDGFSERLSTFGFEPMSLDGEALRAFVVDEMERYDEIVQAAEIRIE